VAMVRGRKNPLHYGLPSRLSKARKAAELTRKAVVQTVGTGQTAVRDIEAGERMPTVGTIARLAAALGCSAAYLAYGLGDMRPDGPPATCDRMGARLQAMRVERGLTKAALARLVELSPSSFAKIENGGQTGVDVLEALAQALAVSPGWLAFGVGPQVLPSRRRQRQAPLP